MPTAQGPDEVVTFRLGYVPGVSPGKWVRGWKARMREPIELVELDVLDDGAALRSGQVDAALVRLPVDRTDLSVIPLYEEVPVVVVPTDHLLTAVDEASADDLEDEVVLHPLDDRTPGDGSPGRPAHERPATTADAIALVAAGVGVLVTPMSLARLHHRKDLTYRPLADGAPSPVGLAWVTERTTDLVEEFIGVVRGRTPNSTRGRGASVGERPAVAGGTEGSATPTAGTTTSRKTEGKTAGKTEGTASGKSGGKATGGTAGSRSAEAKRLADRRAAAARKAAAKGRGRQGKRGRR